MWKERESVNELTVWCRVKYSDFDSQRVVLHVGEWGVLPSNRISCNPPHISSVPWSPKTVHMHSICITYTFMTQFEHACTHGTHMKTWVQLDTIFEI